MNCPHCGAEVPEGDRFCGECGQSLAAPVDTQQTMYAPAAQGPAIQAPSEPAQWPPPQAATRTPPAPVVVPVSSVPEAGARKRGFPWLIAVIGILGLCVVCVVGGAAAYFLVLRPRLSPTAGQVLTAVVTAAVTPPAATVGTPVVADTATAAATATPVPTSTSTPVPTTTYSDGYGAYTVAYPVEWVIVGEVPGEYAFLAETADVSDDLAAGPFFLSLTYAEISDLQALRQEAVGLYEAYDVRDLEAVPAQFAGLESMALMMAAKPPASSAEVRIYALLAIRDGVGQAYLFGAAAEGWEESEPVFQQMTESLSLQGTVTQPEPTPPEITSLVFASAVDEFGNPVGVTDIYPPGTTEVYAVYSYVGFGGLTEYEPVFYLDGEPDASEVLELEGEAEGQTWLRRYAEEGLAPGIYELEIDVGDELLGGGTFVVLGGSVVLEEGFAGTTAWKTWDGDESRVWQEGEQLHVLITEEAWMAYPTYAPQAGGTYGNVYIEADAALVEIPEQGGDYGLIVRRVEEGSYYQFVISDDGFFKIRKHTSEGWSTLLDWVESDAIVQGVNAVNHLQAVAVGSDLLFYVNGIFLGRAVDDAFAEGLIGVSTGSFEGGPGVHAVFDNVAVYEIE